MENVFDTLTSRGFVEQVTDEHAVRDLLSKSITCYIGFDPTAPTLHVGSLVPIMALMHMQRSGHKPIVLVGGGTGMIGDPSGKTKVREILTKARIEENAQAIKKQFSRYIRFGKDKALLLNNADWLLNLGYVEFLRDIGCHFSVNRMLTAESYKARLETGLNFIEFNYMLLQAYDFLYLKKHYHCLLQMGGNDQWGNILAGTDLVRRVEGAKVEAMTFPLLTTASGAKMGKTAFGTIWLDSGLLKPYDFYQYWVNCDDRDVGRFLKLYTFLPLAEIKQLQALKSSDIRKAKQALAYEATSITHGEKAAKEAQASASTAFGRGEGKQGRDLAAMPSTTISRDRLTRGINPAELFTKVGLSSSRGEAKRLIKQGGLYVNDKQIKSLNQQLNEADLTPNGILLRAGKKKYHRIIVK